MVTFKGGARFGWANASWPLATLTVDESTLSIRASVIGSHSFAPEEVIELKVITWFPVIAQGVQVVHLRDDIPQRIIFWTLQPSRVLAAIRDTGFDASAPSDATLPPSVFPVSPLFLVMAVALWNVLLFSDRPWEGDRTMGIGTLTAFGLLFLGSLAIRWSTAFQNMVLRGTNPLGRIRPILNILTLVSGVMVAIGVMMQLA